MLSQICILENEMAPTLGAVCRCTFRGQKSFQFHGAVCVSTSSYDLLKTSLNTPMADVWINKWWYIYSVECYSAVKRNELLTNNNMNEYLNSDAEWKKSEKVHTVYFYIYKFLENANQSKVTESISVIMWCWGRQRVARRGLWRDTCKFFGVIEIFIPYFFQ